MVKKASRQGRRSQASAPQLQAAGTSSALQSHSPKVSNPRTAQQSKGVRSSAKQAAGLATQVAPKGSARSIPDKTLSQPKLTTSAALSQQLCPQDASSGLAAKKRPLSQLTHCPVDSEAEASLAAGQRSVPSATRGRTRRSPGTGHDAPVTDVPGLQPPSKSLPGPGRPECPKRQHVGAPSTPSHDATTSEKAAFGPVASSQAAVQVGGSSPSASRQPLQGLGGPGGSHGDQTTQAAPNLVSTTLQATGVQVTSPQRRSGRQVQRSHQGLPGPAFAACKEGEPLRATAPQEAQQAEPSSAGQDLPPGHQMFDPQSIQLAGAPRATHAVRQMPAAPETARCDDDQPAERAAEQDPAGCRKSSRAGRGKRKASRYSAAELSDEPVALESLYYHHALSAQQTAEEQPAPPKQRRGRSRERKPARVSAEAAKEADGRQVPPDNHRPAAGDAAAAEECKVDGEEAGHQLNAGSLLTAHQRSAFPKQAQPTSAKRKAAKPSSAATDEAASGQLPRIYDGHAVDEDGEADEIKSESDESDAAVKTSLPKASKRKRTFKRQPRQCRKCKQVGNTCAPLSSVPACGSDKGAQLPVLV